MDYGHKQTDKQLQAIINKIDWDYKAAWKHMKKQAQAKLKEFQDEDEKQKILLNANIITKKEYIEWRTKNILPSQAMKDLTDILAHDMSKANQIAAGVINNKLPDIYALNHNYGSYEVDHLLEAGLSGSFSLYDRSTVQRLLSKKPNIIPKVSPDVPQDLRWNRGKIRSVLTRSILTGQPIPQIANDLEAVKNMNQAAAMRSARTFTTAAENGGRYDALLRAKQMGIDIQKEWMATIDTRTRTRHRELDGEIVEVEEPFSNGLLYPGDPDGDPGEIYNCRCTLVAADALFKEDDKKLKEEQFSRLPSNVSYDEWKYGKQNVEAKKLEKRLTEVEKKAANLAQTTYSGIWADDVTVADYSSKANSIQGKRDYYDEELKKYNALSQITNEAEFAEIRAKYDDEIKRGAFIFLDEEDKEALRKMVSNVDSSVWLGQHDLRRLIEEGKGYADNRVLYLTQRVQQLEDFEKKGKLYLQYQDEINKINEKLFKLGGGINPFGPDAYSQARLQNALRFDRRLQADKYLRPLLDKDWDKLTDHEKYSIWEYTRNSNPMNKSLSGYHDSWNRRDFLGLENTVWGHEDDWRSLSGFFRIFCKKGTYGDVDYHQAITALTNAIDKCKTNKDMWLVRGSDRSGFARLLEGNLFSFDEAVQILKSGSEEKMKKALVGQTFTNHSFMSTGIAEDAGFGGNVMYSIYAPKGTKGVYAEPQSYYGDTADDRLYKKGMKFHSVGGEAEMILQRGTQFRIRNITYDGWNIHVEMEIVGQPNYFKFGDEDTFNNGKTRHKK